MHGPKVSDFYADPLLLYLSGDKETIPRSFQVLADKAFADLLKKHKNPVRAASRKRAARSLAAL
jgi:hypothetical protein